MVSRILYSVVAILIIIGLLGHEVLQLEKSMEVNTRIAFNKEQYLLSKKIVGQINDTLKNMRQDALYLRFSYAQIQMTTALYENNTENINYWKSILTQIYHSFLDSHPLYERIDFIGYNNEKIVEVTQKNRDENIHFQESEIESGFISPYLRMGKEPGAGSIDLVQLSVGDEDYIAAITPHVYNNKISRSVLYLNIEYIHSIMNPEKSDDLGHSVLFDEDGKLIYCSWGLTQEDHMEESKVVMINPSGYAEIPESHGEKNVMIATNYFSVGKKKLVIALLSTSEVMIAHFKEYKEKKQRIFFLLVVMVIIFIVYISIANAARIREKEQGLMLYKVEQLNVELTNANDRLMKIDQIKTDFLNIVAHDIRTPLTSIRAYADMLLTYKNKPDTIKKVYEEFLGVIIKESKRLGDLIADYLDLSKLESGSMTFRKEPLKLEEVVQDILQLYKGEASEKDIHLYIESTVEIPEITGDDGKMRQVMSNILGNAIKFTPTGGVVKVVLENDKSEYAKVTITDTGPGISKADTEKIFDKFVQIENIDTNIVSGVGLGLPICKNIIERHGGKIWVESRKDTGAVVVFTLPLTEPQKIA